MNPSQLIEAELNAMSQIIEERLRVMANNDVEIEEMENLLFSYISAINPTQGKELKKIYDNVTEEEFNEFWDDILYGLGILIHQPPFFGNINIDKLFDIFDEYDITLPRHFEGIEEPLIMGQVYYMVLKHHPKTKYSSRSSQYTSTKDIPSKSMRFKDKLQPYQTTPIKIGEMEMNNLFICKQIDEVLNMVSMYSTNKEDRNHMNMTMLTTNNPFNIEKIETKNSPSRTSIILETNFNSLGIELKEKNNIDEI